MNAIEERLFGRRPAEAVSQHEVAPYEPLIVNAFELWQVLQPRREANTHRSAFLSFYYPRNWPESADPNVRTFDHLMRRYIDDPGPDPRTQNFTVALCVNPDYRKCHPWEDVTREPEDFFESPVSFQLWIWGPVPLQFPDSPNRQILQITEVPLVTTPLFVMSEGPQPLHRSECVYDLVGLDGENREPLWRRPYISREETIEPFPIHMASRYRLHPPPGDMSVKREFVASVLDHLTEMVRGVNETELAEFNARMQEKRSQGLLELGSIAHDISRGDCLAMAFRCSAGYIYY